MTPELLDSSDPLAVAAYERAFFAAFRRATENRLVRIIWNWDMDNERLSTRIPYEDQLIYVLRDPAGDVRVAMAGNIAMREFQSAAFGFTPPPGPGVFELVTFFSNAPGDLRGKMRLWRRMVADLRARGFHTAVATTAERPLFSYIQTGWTIENETRIDGERRIFLKYDLAQGGAPETRRHSAR